MTPYIQDYERDEARWHPKDPGELNFAIHMIVRRYLGDKEPSYADWNEVIGALECAKLELYRRRIAPYEDKKLAMNGDVW